MKMIAKSIIYFVLVALVASTAIGRLSNISSEAQKDDKISVSQSLHEGFFRSKAGDDIKAEAERRRARCREEFAQKDAEFNAMKARVEAKMSEHAQKADAQRAYVEGKRSEIEAKMR